MTDLDRLHDLARACVQAAQEVEDTGTAAMLLESAHRFLNRANPELAQRYAEQHNRQHRPFEH